ncbi:P-loop NTPase fold protein [Capnocytophaga gingivalis]|uniref:P-loop NTPase fold protein n=1 Tax=Capnocytophaga gingivalis TaxID=1017 RepID=UPI0028F0C13D|nr:P-loop NTPase fold protein [Capnocytophaga gingivalis]
MQKIIDIVKDYLTRETNNALLITGEWGVGKTYFFNNILSKEIEKVSTKENESVKYKPIRVSLSGVTSIDDIERRIVEELYPSLNKGLKWGKGILKFVLSVPKIKEYIPEIPNSDVIGSETDNLVICFDDLERRSKTFPIDSLIGYINNLTENNNLKTIIIANTNKIEDESFDEIKEKLIGREIEYKINIEEVFDTLIQSEFQSFSEYTKFLQKEKNFICSFFQDYKNIRTLKFILTRYHDIYSQIEKIAHSIQYIQSNKEVLLKDTLLFTIAIAIEHKKGKITRNSKEEVDNKIRITRKNLEKYFNKQPSSKQEIKEEDKTILETIKSKYYNENNFSYFFYESIFDYIIGLNVLDEDLLDKDIKEKYKISKDNTIPESYKLYNQIDSDEVFSMSNDTYKQLLKEMLSYVDKGEYGLEDYLFVYSFVLDFNNPLKIKEKTLKKRIIKGIKKGKDKFAYTPKLQRIILHSKEVNEDENLKEIADLCLTINGEKELEKNKKDGANLINILKNDFAHFEHQVKHKYNNIPIFAYINGKTIFKFYNDNRDLRIRLFEVFNHRYIYYEEGVLQKEKDFYTKLQQSIEKKANQLKLGPEWYSYTTFNELLEKIIDTSNKKTSN